MRSEDVAGFNRKMGYYQERGPKDRRSNREMIVQMTGQSELVPVYASVRINPSHPKTAVCVEPIFCEIEIAVD